MTLADWIILFNQGPIDYVKDVKTLSLSLCVIIILFLIIRNLRGRPDK